MAVVALLAVAGLAAGAAQAAALRWLGRPWALSLLALAASSLLAQRSLWQHVAAVADGLDRGLPEGRMPRCRTSWVATPDSLDAGGVARAAIESLAENFSDGVVAPALWCALFGLPGIALYKVVNTADSMIGHRTPRHAAFGWAAARLDDLVNLPASRLAALLLALASGRECGPSCLPRRVAGCRAPPLAQRRLAGGGDGRRAGAAAGRPAGLRDRHGWRMDQWMGDGRSGRAGTDDIRRGLALYRRACALLWVGLGRARRCLV